MNDPDTEVLRELIEGNDRRYEEHFQAQETAMSAALAATEKAVSKAEIAQEKWKEGSNEWRAAMNDRERLFLSRPEYDQAHKSLEEKVQLNTSKLERLEGKSIGLNASWLILGQFISMLTGIVAIVITIIR